MSARDVMEARITAAFGPALGQSIPPAIEDALTAAGWRIVGPDEVDPISIEKAAQLAEAFCWERYREGGKLKSPAVSNSHTKDAIGEAIRAIASGGKQ